MHKTSSLQLKILQRTLLWRVPCSHGKFHQLKNMTATEEVQNRYSIVCWSRTRWGLFIKHRHLCEHNDDIYHQKMAENEGIQIKEILAKADGGCPRSEDFEAAYNGYVFGPDGRIKERPYVYMSSSGQRHLTIYIGLCLFICLIQELVREHAKSHWVHLFDFSPLCVFKCVLKLPAREDAKSHWVHLFDFSAVCVFKCFLKSPAWEDA